MGYVKFSGSVKILSNNKTEFKNQLLTNMATQLGEEHKIYIPPYHPQSNGRMKASIIVIRYVCLNMY